MLKVRQAKIQDCDILFEWRNDPHSRCMFRNSAVVSYNDHRSWFEASLSDPDVLILMFENEVGLTTGVVRFNRTGSGAECSINLAPAFRGLGLGSSCLALAVDWVEKFWGLTEVLTASIKPENHASVKVFEDAGFRFVGFDGGFAVYKKYK